MVASSVDFQLLPQEEKDSLIERLCLKYPTFFFETLSEIHGEPFVLEEYQANYLLDENPFTCMVATRQGGKSLIVAAKHFFKALTTHGYRCDIVSINLKEATDKIQYVKMFYESLPDRWKLPNPKKNELSMGFHNGAAKLSLIRSLAASEGVRGGRKNYVFDEFAHWPYPEKILHGAAPAIMRMKDAGFDILSTPAGRKNLFGQIYLNEPDARGIRAWDLFSRHKFGWWDVSQYVTAPVAVVRDRWVNDLNENMALMPQLVEEFGNDRIQWFYSIFPFEVFKQEFCCDFLSEDGVFFTWDLINKSLRSDHKDEEERLEKWTARPEGNVNDVYIGIDFAEGRKGGDATSIQILEKVRDGRMLHRYSEVLQGDYWNDFDHQIAHILDLVERFNPKRVSVDGTGLGVPLGKGLKKDLGERCEAVNFNPQSKEDMALNLKGLMEKEKIWLQYDDKQLHAQIYGIERKIGESGVIRYKGEPHDDMFWALCLAARGAARAEFRAYRLGRR